MIPNWLKFWKSDEPDIEVEARSVSKPEETPRNVPSIEDFREGVKLTAGEEDKVRGAIKEDLSYLDEAPVPVFEATNMVPGKDDVSKHYPMTRIFLPTHYGKVLFTHVYVFHAVPTEEGITHEWYLVDDSEEARIVLGERTVDNDPMEWLES